MSDAGLLGGSTPPRPGEVSLAHGGTLFLDEVNEFRRNTLEALRNTLRDGEITLCRGGLRASFPAKPRLVIGAMNPCPCGWYSEHGAWPGATPRCKCDAARVKAYRARALCDGLFEEDEVIELPPFTIAR